MKNILGREIPDFFAGRKSLPFEGVNNKIPSGSHQSVPYQKRLYKLNDDKIVKSIEEAIKKVDLKDGMTISFHHHLRNGDYVVNMVTDVIGKLGIKDITIAPSALFPVHGKPLIDLVKDGVITHIEGSMNGPLGNAVSRNEIDIKGVLRSHGGRTRAIQSGELQIDVTFIAASAADRYGNITGKIGPTAFGSMGYMIGTDEIYAKHIIAITDNIVEYPLGQFSIPGARVDYVVPVNKIGDPKGIATGTLTIKTDERTQKIVDGVLGIIEHSGILKTGFSFQSGAGGISLAVTKGLSELMETKKVQGSYIFGGVTGFAVDLLEQGHFKTILDGQSFDLKAVKSLRDNPNHVEISIESAYNPWNKGCFLNDMDVAVLGATEVDVDFNVNVNTYSNGLLNHGIGGHQDASNSRITVITVPLARKVPIIVDKVTTITTPGENIAVIVTNDGIAINPKYSELQKNLSNSELPIFTIKELRDRAYTLAHKPELSITDEVTTIVQWRDGTVLDSIYQMKE